MTTQEQISKLQGLLARIHKNASRPRVAAKPGLASAESASSTPASPQVAAARPPAAVAPPAFAPAPPPPPAFAPPRSATPPLSYAVSAPSTADQSVDDLLGASLEASPLPVSVDMPLDSVPPVAETTAAATPAGGPPRTPAPAAYDLEAEVSEVRFALPVREPAQEVTLAAIAAEAEIVATEELSEEDLVDVTEAEGTPGAAAAGAVDIDFDDEDEEQPPASSQHSKLPSSMDEALAAAAAELDGDLDVEVPLKTPPPESGPQEAAMTGMPLGSGRDADSLVGQELDIATRGDSGTHPAHVPTAEQLGQTIELDEPRGPSLELAEAAQSSVPPTAAEELEVSLPPRSVVSGFDDLMPPPEAREDLAAHRRRLEEDVAPPPESLAQYPSVQPSSPVAQIVPITAAPATAASAPFTPELVQRSASAGHAESFTSARESFRPSSFVELLDASLSLGD